MPRSPLFRTALLLLTVGSSLAWPQGSLGGLTGRVADPSGAGVPGASVKIRNLDTSTELDVTTSSDGEYGAEGYIYQAYAGLPNYDNNYPVIGSWIVGDMAAGIGIREDNSEITKDTSRFVPHYFV